ncbi:EPN2 protein, partial [Prunella fulvescens]|nr:EPN2 protein [Prunella fulvescens]
MTTSSIRRQMKNIVNNYSEAEIKVREATSNDPWGPSSSLMTEIADLTYNVVAFSEIMSMIWKRLNDHGKNWRHVYKALTLLDYLIKTGSERVAQQCKENIFAIQTLKDFQYIDRDGKDQGINVREKSKQLVSLLKDDERLKTERAQALKTKERMAQVATGVGSNQITFGRGSSQPNLSTSYSEQEYGKSGGSPASYHGCKYRQTHPKCFSLEVGVNGACGRVEMLPARGSGISGDLLWAEERLRRGDDLRLQMALEESRRDTIKIPKKKEVVPSPKKLLVMLPKAEIHSASSCPQHTTLLDLMDALPSSAPAPPKSEPWGPPAAAAAANQTDPWGGSSAAAPASDPWQSFGAKPAASVDPWAAPAGSTAQPLAKNVDPWAPAQPSSTAAKSSVDPWGSAPANKPLSTSGSTSFDLFSNLNGTVKDDFSEFDTLRTSKKPAESGSTLPSQHSGTTSPDLFESQHSSGTSGKQSTARKTPESFLGPNAALVNLDSLVSKPPQPVTSLNPFLAPGAATTATPINPFQVNQPQPLTLNQMRASPVLGSSPSF